jgi:hypothetical protein
MALFLKEHKRILLLLAKHEVKFILIGGYAVIYYGYERTTTDMDIWLKPTNENRNKFIGALEEDNFVQSGLDDIHKMNFTKPQVLHIGKRPNKIDFLTKPYGLNFKEAAAKQVLLPLQDHHIPVLHFDHLIISKMLLGRPQDKADVDMLQKIREAKNDQ